MNRFKVIVSLQLIVLCIVKDTSAKTAKIIVGSELGIMSKCEIKEPDKCVHFNYVGSPINGIAIIGNSIFSGLGSGVLLHCELDNNNTCSDFHTTNGSVNGVAASGEYVYAGLESGVMWRCAIDTPNSCVEFNKADVGIKSIAVADDSIYAGLASGAMWKCQKNTPSTCYQLNRAGTPLNAVVVINNNVYAGTGWGTLWRCLADKIYSCTDLSYVATGIQTIGIYYNTVYLILNSGEFWKCVLDERDSCIRSTIKFESKVLSLVTTYATTDLLPDYAREDSECVWQEKNRCPPYVAYYDLKKRSALELHVKDGKLYNYQGELLDTKQADFSHSGRKAIFAMDPVGNIYASIRHSLYLFHESSFLAGGSVAAAGEIKAISGEIVRITNCSGHYSIDSVLLEQVVDALKKKSYSFNVTLNYCKDLQLIMDLNYYNVPPKGKEKQ